MVIGSGIILISNDTSRILLGRRTDSGAWANFGGTMVDFETLYQCVVREIKEETGFVLNREYKIVGKRPFHHKETPRLNYHMFLALAQDEPIPKLNDEHSDYGWFDITDLPHPLHYGLMDILTTKKVIKTIEKIKYEK